MAFWDGFLVTPAAAQLLPAWLPCTWMGSPLPQSLLISQPEETLLSHSSCLSSDITSSSREPSLVL